MQSLLADFNAARPHFRKAGFRLLSLQIQLGIPPKLVPQFSSQRTDDAAVEEAKAALEDNRIGKAILGALLKASTLERHVRIPELQFTSLEVKLSGMPRVSLNYEGYFEPTDVPPSPVPIVE